MANNTFLLPEVEKQTKEIIRRVQEVVLSYLYKANNEFARDFVCPAIYFDVKGFTAGLAYPRRNVIRFNPFLLVQNEKDFLANTVPHEVAHIITYKLYGPTRPHGKEWQHVMNVLGVKPERCHNYDVSNCFKRKTQRFSYVCGCREHDIGLKSHRNICNGINYTCKVCKTRLKPK